MRLVLVLFALVAGCSAPAPEVRGTPQPAPTRASPAPDVVTGLVIEVHRSGKQVVGFVVESDGAMLEILIDPDRDYGFNLRHLEEHREAGDPVEVDVEARGADLFAVSILDA